MVLLKTPQCITDTINGVRQNLFSNELIDEIPRNTDGWTTENLDWSDKENQNIKRILNSPNEWNFIGNIRNIAKGRLIGGCLEVIQFLNNTQLWPNLSTWDQAILFLETSEEGIEPYAVTRFMRNLAAQGILKRLSGILFSKPGGRNMTAACFPEYDQALLSVFEEYTIPLIPIVTGMDFGHSDPMWVLPYGAMTEIDPDKKTVRILENAVEITLPGRIRTNTRSCIIGTTVTAYPPSPTPLSQRFNQLVDAGLADGSARKNWSRLAILWR
jgi:muramoyltetrapeptide carboxypeptidase LdcA involved in peptidoglycan recycling